MKQQNRAGSEFVNRRNTWIEGSLWVLIPSVLIMHRGGLGQTKLFIACFSLLALVSLVGIVGIFVGTAMAEAIEGGKILTYAQLNNPGKTMLEQIRRNGYQVEDIKSVHLMTCNLSDAYINNFRRELKLGNDDLEVLVCGYEGDRTAPRHTDGTKLLALSRKNTKHVNVVRFKNSETILVWFEPRHNVRIKNGKEFHHLPFGAIMLEASEEYVKAAWEECMHGVPLHALPTPCAEIGNG